MDGQDWGTNGIVWLLRQILQRGGALIDVGANIGLVTIPIALDGIPVAAFEMLPANCLKLNLACLLNRLDRVRVVQAAISSTNGLLAFGGEHAWGTVGTGGQIACALRLDTAMALGGLEEVWADGRHLVIKIDVEGHELEVLKGASELIATRRPAILFESIEFADGGDDQASKLCKRFLETRGYRLFLQRGNIVLPRNSSDLQEGLVADFLAVPADRLEMLDGLEVRDLTPAERARWVDEMAVEIDVAHRKHAVAAIQALRLDETYVPLTAEAASRLLQDGEPAVSHLARLAGF
jgi:FkbM family methyltransferase